MSGTFLPTATRASVKVAYFATETGINVSSINTNTITVDGDGAGTGISMLNNADIIFADGATVGANSMAIANFDGGISTLAGVKTPLSIYDYGNGTYGTTQVGGLIIGGSASTNDGSGSFAIIDGNNTADLSIASRVMDLQVSSITNTLGNFIQFEENLIVRPPLGQTTAGGSVNIFNGASCSNFNQYSLTVNGDGALGGQLALTRFQGGSSYPVLNVDNDGNMLFKDPGAIVYADNLSTIALQAGSIVVPGQGRTLISTGSPVPSVTLTNTGTVGNVDFGGSIGQFIPVTVGSVVCLQGAIAVTASAGVSTPFTVNVVSTDGVSPGVNYPVYSGIGTAPYATGTGSMASIYVPITTTLKAGFDKISVSASCPGLTGGQTLTVDMGAVTLVRIV
jgi:hypothetical protein